MLVSSDSDSVVRSKGAGCWRGGRSIEFVVWRGNWKLDEMMSGSRTGGGRQGRMRNRAAVVALWLWLVVSALAGVGEGEEVGSESTLGDADCLYERKDACVSASEAAGCVWCDLRRRCYSAARSLDLGEFCTRKKPQQQAHAFVEVAACDEIVDRSDCSREVNCRWCRSEAVDDGCFRAIEAVRLPKQIFTCQGDSLSSATKSLVGIGM